MNESANDEIVDVLALDGFIGWPASGVVSAPTQAYLLDREEWIAVEVTVRLIEPAS